MSLADSKPWAAKASQGFFLAEHFED
jgi:hypothetical protein